MGSSSSSTVPSSALMMWLVFASNLVHFSQAIWLNLPASGPKCVSEEIQNNVVVLADYHVIRSGNVASATDDQGVAAVSVKVTSPFGNNLYNRENVTQGKFAFTTHETGNYLACFWVEGGTHAVKKEAAAVGDLSISLDWKFGIAAKDWESVAKKEKIEGVELELRKLEGAVEAIHENLIHLKAKEAQMRQVDETTNSRVAWFSILSLAVCITVAICQLLYLKRYFQKKKLI